MEERRILFTTDATITFDEYVRYSNRICRFRNILSYILWIGITGAFCVWAVISGRYPHALMAAAVCISKVASSPAVKMAKLKKAFAEEDSVGNCYLVYDFYEDGFIMTCNMEPCELCHYWELDSIVETKTNFYFRYNGDNGCILIKDNCSPQLIHFLHTMKDDTKGPLYNEGMYAMLPGPAEYFGIPYEVIHWKESPEGIVDRYKKALQCASVEGYPVIFENDEKTMAVLEALEEEMDRESLLAWEPSEEMPLPDGKKLLEEWYRDRHEGQEVWEHPQEERSVQGKGSPQDTFIATELCFHTFDNDDLIMLKFPVDAPWKVLAYFPLYGWGDHEEVAELMAVGKYWYEKYGAVPAVFGCNILEFWAEDLRISEEDAWRLAKEQTAFHDNALEICTKSGTVGELADDLQKTRTWFFMWEPFA